MAFLRIDPTRIELSIQVGVLETYNPDKEIEELHKDVEGLKKKFRSSLKRIVGNIETQAEGLEILRKDEDKLKKWEKYVNGTFSKQMADLQERIREKNKEICPNFEEFFKGR